jgi:hypothetical protein
VTRLTGLHGLGPSASQLSSCCASVSMDGRMRLDRDFSEFIGFLSAHEVRFLVVGGYAVAVHGPRAIRVISMCGCSSIPTTRSGWCVPLVTLGSAPLG